MTTGTLMTATTAPPDPGLPAHSPDQPDPAAIPGVDSPHPWSHGWAAWKQILKRVYTMDGYHNLSLMAAGVAFYAFLSFVPLLGAIVMTYGLVADPASVGKTMEQIIRLVPAEAAKLIQDQLLSITSTASEKAGLGLVVALFLSVFGAMRASSALIQALNVIYEEEEGRSIVRTYLVAARLTLVAVLAGIVGLLAAGALAYLRSLVGILGVAGVTLIQILTWLVAGAIATAGFGYAYRYGPDRAHARWQWLSVGSTSATVLWLIATVLFGVYAANFGNYNATYGALGAVVVLLMWMWVSSYAVLIGAEINAEAERQTGIDSTTGNPRPRGRRGATVADSLPSKRQAKPRRDRY